jgi:hypothetical protein
MASKIIITRKVDDVITNIADTAVAVENGLKITTNGQELIITCMTECNQYSAVETADTIIPGKYKYTTAGGFIVDPSYKPYVSVEEQLENMKTLNAQMLTALVSAGLM